MKEGEPVLGGPQVSPGNVQPTNPGVQPAGFETLQNSQNAQAAPLTPPTSSTFTSNVPLGETQPNNPTPQPAPVSPPTSTQSQFFAQPTAPNMGDVVLSDTPPQKPKKGLIVGIILVLIILTVAGLGLALLLKNNLGITGESMGISFENFVSYLMNEDNVSDIENFDAAQTYAIDAFFQKQGTSQANEYFEELNKRWQSFSEKNTTNFNQEAISVIDEDLDALYLYIEEKNTPKEEILKRYLKEGRDAVFLSFPDHFIENDYTPSDILSQYVAAWDDYLNRLIDLFDIYIENGCVVGDNLDEKCVRSKDLYQQDIYGQFEISKEALKNYAYELKNEIKEQTGNLIISMGQENDS